MEGRSHQTRVEKAVASPNGPWIRDSRPVQATDRKAGGGRLRTPHRLPLGRSEAARRLLDRRGRLRKETVCRAVQPV